MSSRRRVNNKTRGRSRKTNLDDLDGSLNALIGKQQEVKVVVDPAEEHRFTMPTSNVSVGKSGIFASSLRSGDAPNMAECDATQPSNFEKHQVNYSATKYIKPWRTGTKSQQLPPKAGHNKNSGKGGKTYE